MFEAFILTGGRSSRMGREKASILVGGRTMLERAASALSDAGASSIKIVSSFSLFDGYETIPDIYEGKGALGGIHAALANASGEFSVIAACDLPFVSSEFLKRLVGIFNSEKHDCAVPVQPDGRPQPLMAVYARANCLAACEALLHDDSSSHAVNALLEGLDTRFVQFKEYSDIENAGRLLMNINTPEDLAKAIEQGVPD